jgi:hypothetical protein
MSLPVYRSLKDSYAMFLLGMIFISLSVTGYGTLKDARGWGRDIIR